MNYKTMIAIAYGAMWIALAVGVSVGIWITHDPKCLWAFGFGLMVRIHVDDKGEEQ